MNGTCSVRLAVLPPTIQRPDSTRDRSQHRDRSGEFVATDRYPDVREYLREYHHDDGRIGLREHM